MPHARSLPLTRILLIEDSNTDALLIQTHLRKADSTFMVRREVRLADGLAQVDRGEADVILLDLNLPDSSGLDTFRTLYRHALQVPIVVLSGQDDVDLAVDAVALGAQDYLPKGEVSRSSLSRSIRYAIERSRRQRAEQELTAAGEIQRRLFPQKSPRLEGFDINGRCEPANKAGGDYFDYFPMQNGCLGIVVADVAGHGIGPALIMSETRAILRSLATTHADPGDILTRANQVLSEDLHNNVFVALILVCLDPHQRQLRFASAGHPGLLFDPYGQVRTRIRSGDPPLGVIEDHRFETHEYQGLQTGDSLLLFTDGIVESFNDRDEQFGEEQVINTVTAMVGHSSRQTIDEIFERVHRFESDTAYQDDRTAVLVKVLNGGS
jgi:sigma-B regulation protein RsbU (phosphoserine phosphatase)